MKKQFLIFTFLFFGLAISVKSQTIHYVETVTDYSTNSYNFGIYPLEYGVDSIAGGAYLYINMTDDIEYSAHPFQAETSVYIEYTDDSNSSSTGYQTVTNYIDNHIYNFVSVDPAKTIKFVEFYYDVFYDDATERSKVITHTYGY